MKEDIKKVLHKGTVVGEAVISTYETLAELQANESEAAILSLFNKQNTVRIMNNERAKHTTARTGKRKRLSIAYQCLTPAEAESVYGNYDALQTLLESADVQARVDAKVGESAAGVETEKVTDSGEVDGEGEGE